MKFLLLPFFLIVGLSVHAQTVDTTHTLDDHTVSGKKPLIEHKADRTIYNVENSLASIGSDALEALKHAPGVKVDINGNVSLAGKSSVSVMLNGRLVQLSGDELAGLLRSIPADELSRIEIITTPPARYDAEGNSGLINIITKKGNKKGLNGDITLSTSQNSESSYSGNGAFNYRHNSLNIFGNGNAGTFRSRPVENYEAFFPDQSSYQHMEERHLGVFNRIQLGADYRLNSKSTLGILYTLGQGGHGYGIEDHILNTYRNMAGLIDSSIATDATGTERGLRNVVNVNYEWRIDTNGRKLNIDLDYFNRSGRKTRTLLTQSYNEDELPIGQLNDNLTKGNQVVRTASAKADMDWPTRVATFSFGGKYTYIHNNSYSDAYFRNGSDYAPDLSKTNSFDYQDETSALYISAARIFGKWETQLGLRGEHTETNAYSPSLNQRTKRQYSEFFPTAYLLYRISDESSMTVNYSRRIQRPSFWTMNPFRNYYTNTSYYAGNPFLQPAFSNNFELIYTAGDFFTVKAYNSKVTDLQINVQTLDTATGSIIFGHQNAGTQNSYGLSMESSLQPFKWWEATAGITGSYGTFTANGYTDVPTYSSPSWYFETEHTLTFGKDKNYAAELSFEYQSIEQYGFEKRLANYELGLGFKALFLNKTVIAAINVNDLLRTDVEKTTNDFNHTITDNYYDNRSIRFAITWKFGNQQLERLRQRKVEQGE